MVCFLVLVCSAELVLVNSVHSCMLFKLPKFKHILPQPMKISLDDA